MLARLDILGSGAAAHEPHGAAGAGRVLVGLALAGALFGAAMGCYPGPEGPRALQVLYSAIKVPMLLLVSFVLCVPSFVVISTLLGLRGDTGRALGAILRAQATLAVVLASLAPYALLWYASFAGHDAAVLFNGVLFGVATVGAQFTLRRRYRLLAARDPRHRVTVWIWLVLYAFVGVQMAWVLRPFVGNPEMETRFFRPDGWSNAYVWLAGAFARAL